MRRDMFMYMHMCRHIYTCMCECAAHAGARPVQSKGMSLNTSVCMYICMHVYIIMNVCEYMHRDMYMYTCMYICICIRVIVCVLHPQQSFPYPRYVFLPKSESYLYIYCNTYM